MAPLFFHKAESSEPGGYFCQWYEAKFTAEGQTFNCCEQYMMWSKAKHFNDSATMTEIMKTKQPRKQKQLGRQVQNFNEQEWDKVKFNVVVQGNYYKFTQCVAQPSDVNNRINGAERLLKEVLLETGIRELVEASPFDRVWGIGFSADAAAVQMRSVTGYRDRWGENLLGKALMEVRERLRSEEEGE